MREKFTFLVACSALFVGIFRDVQGQGNDFYSNCVPSCQANCYATLYNTSMYDNCYQGCPEECTKEEQRFER